MRKIKLYDTTLRDGAQGEGITYSLIDKVRIAQRLDSLRIHYIEGGWPGSNPKDMQFFKRMSKKGLRYAQLVAFGSTRRAGISANRDKNLQYPGSSGRFSCRSYVAFSSSGVSQKFEGTNTSLQF